MSIITLLKKWGIFAFIIVLFFPILLKAQNIFGYDLQFDGINGMVSINDTTALHQPDHTQKLTIEAWINASVLQNWATIVEKAPDRWGLYSMADGSLVFYLRSPKSVNLHSHKIIEPGKWYHVAAVFDSSAGTAKIFINGKLDTVATSQTAQINGQTGGLGIGRDTDLNDGKFNGYIDEVRVSSSARYDSSFSLQFVPFTPDSNTVVLYHFDEGSGLLTADASSNKLDATLSGGVTWAISSILQPVFTANQTLIDFGVGKLGSILTDTVNVSNTGTDTLKITSVTSSNNNFSPLTKSGSIAPGSTGQFIVSYLPLQNGAQSGIIVFNNNSPDSTDTIQVKGTANLVTGFDQDLQFNGIDGMASTDDSPTLHQPDHTQKLTIEAWINASVLQNWATIVEKAPDRWALYSMADGSLVFYIRSPKSVNLHSTKIIEPGKWYHVAAVYDSSAGTAKIFVNGKLDTMITSQAAQINGQTGGLGIGRDTDLNDGKFNGYIDEVRVSSSARYDSSFSLQFIPFTPDSNTVALYHFNEGSGLITGDASGNGNNCTLSGGVTWNSVNELPVELISFNSKVVGNNVELNWKTATETNNSGFAIQREETNKGFSNIGFVKGRGTSTQPNTYLFIDKNVKSGKYQYRLQQIDYDGTFKYSKVIQVEVNSGTIPSEYSLSQNYPNPFNPSTIIKFNLSENSSVKLTVYDILGRMVKELVNKELNAGQYTINFNASNLASGVYLYKLDAIPNSKNSHEFIMTKTMVLLK